LFCFPLGDDQDVTAMDEFTNGIFLHGACSFGWCST
jgi:hypothetical protein